MRTQGSSSIALAFFFSIFMLALCRPACAQDDFEQGVLPYQSYHTSDFDSVNLSNGNLVLHIPLLSYPQRGALPPIQIYIGSNSSTHVVAGHGACTTTKDQTHFGGEVIRFTPFLQPSSHFAVVAFLPYCRPTYYLNHRVSDDSAALHYFGTSGSDSTTWVTSDARYTYSTTSTGVLTDRHGIMYTIGQFPAPPPGTHTITNPTSSTISLVQDPSGNQMIRAFDKTSGSYSWADSLGRIIPDNFPSTLTSGCYVQSFPGVNGGTIQLKLCPSAGSDSVTLPNGKAWTFTYTTDGNHDIASVTLPTGGTVSYRYATRNTCAPGVTSQAVISRTVDAQDGTPPKTWTYVYTGTTTTVTDPTGNDTVHTFTAIGTTTCALRYETKTQYYTGSSAAGTRLKTLDTTYTDGGYDPVAYGWAIEYGVFPKSVTTTLPTGQVAAENLTYDSTGEGTFYDPSTGPSSAVPLFYGDVTDKYEYDYGNGARGPLLRQTHYTYQWQGDGRYQAANMLDLRSAVTIFDGSPQQVASTSYGYDENNGSPQGIIGNQTSVTSWLKGGASPKSQTIYNAQGMPSQIINNNSNKTKIVYDSTGMFVNKIQYPDTTSNGVTAHHIESFTYDPNIARMTSHTDENNQPTIYSYDPMSRLLGVTFPAGGGSQTYVYNDATTTPSYTFTEQLNSGTNLTEVGVLDGMGRSVQTKLTSDPDGTDFTDTAYDALGRVFKQSNSYRSAASPTDGVTTYFYDGLGRMCLEVPPDGTLPSGNPCLAPQPANTVFTSYTGNTTTVTDQAGRSRKSVTDGLGRLTQIFEDPAGGNYETDYQYDALDNLKRVDQKGGSTDSAKWRTRTFTYDSLSRLLTATNPESGTMNYTYDANGNLRIKTSPAPNQPGSATVTLAYCYDALNRLTTKAYTLQTCTNGTFPSPVAIYLYDQSSYNGLTITNGIGRRTGMIDQAGSEAWSYDQMGRATTDQRTTNGITKTITYAYNPDSSLASMTYPPLYPGYPTKIFTYQQGGAGRPLSLTAEGLGLAVNAHYTPSGDLCYIQHGWGSTFTASRTFNNRLQPVTFGVVHQDAGSYPTVCAAMPVVSPPLYNDLNLTYSYVDSNGHNNGNIVSETNNLDWTRTQTYTYDSLNRVSTARTSSTAASSSAHCWGEQFGYDVWSNLLSISPVSTAYTGCMQESLSVAANNNNQLIGYAYDSAGNMTNDGLHTYAYDAENHLVSAAGVNYSYDGDGKRAMKSNGMIYWYGTNSAPLLETDLGGNFIAFYTFFNGQRNSRSLPDNETDFYDTDRLGNTRVFHSFNGRNATFDGWIQSDYYPFGGERVVSTGGVPNHFKFTGKERDAESGLDNFGARYYSNSMGRFLSVDPLKNNPVLSLPPALNRYAHANNNPLRYVDPNGLCSVPVEGVGPGQIGLCIDSFIMSERMGLLDLGYGDNRGPIGNDASATYKYQAQVVVDLASGRIVAKDSAPGKSCAIFKSFCRQGSKSDSITTTKDAKGNTLLAIQATAANGFRGKGGPRGTIRLDLLVRISPDGKVAIGDSSRATIYPSLEIYSYNSEGKVTIEHFSQESDDYHDLEGPMFSLPFFSRIDSSSNSDPPLYAGRILHW
jgi:RHS repeat-associated protein